MRSATVAYWSGLKKESVLDIGSLGSQRGTSKLCPNKARNKGYLCQLCAPGSFAAVTAPLALFLARHRRHRRHDRVGDLVFDGENVFHVAIENVGPLHDVVRRAAQTRRHPQAIADALYRSLEHEARIEARRRRGIAVTTYRARTTRRQYPQARGLHQLPGHGD